MRRFLLVFALAVGVLALLAAPALASPKTFYVHPSGGNDAANIQAAFNAAVKAGPGSTVQLSAGTFYTNNIVVQNFDGYFKGAGEDRTAIDCLRGLDPSLPGATEAGNPGYWLSLFLFEGGTIGVSDMSFDITAASPAEQWNNAGSPADYLGAMVQVCGNASSSFNRVGFSAGAGNDSGYNADEGLLISGIGPLGTQADAGAISEPRATSLRLPLGHLQPFRPPDALHAFGVHRPAGFHSNFGWLFCKPEHDKSWTPRRFGAAWFSM